MDVNKEIEDILHKIYTAPENVGSFGGVERLYRAASTESNKPISRQQVKNYLKAVDAYTLHKDRHINFPRQPMLASGIDSLWQADLVILQTLARYNDGYQNILMVIDVFSRYAFAEPLRTKQGPEVRDAFDRIIQRTGRIPRMLNTDRGTEFLNVHFQKYLKDKGIGFFPSYNDTKAAICERLNRTIKERMWRYFDQNHTLKYIDILQSLINSYNHSKHRALGMAPNDVTAETQERIRKIFEKSVIKRRANKKTKFKRGEAVRMLSSRNVFAKRYEEKWTDEIVFIDKIYAKTEPVMYRVRDSLNETIKGRYYERELQAVKKPEVYIIEKILKKRHLKGKLPEFFVKWQGYSDRFNSWVTEEDMNKDE